MFGDSFIDSLTARRAGAKMSEEDGPDPDDIRAILDAMYDDLLQDPDEIDWDESGEQDDDADLFGDDYL